MEREKKLQQEAAKKIAENDNSNDTPAPQIKIRPKKEPSRPFTTIEGNFCVVVN